jgi:hypothetical protein
MKADKKAIFAGASKASEAAAFLAALQSGCVSTVPATSSRLRTSGPTRYARSRRLPPPTTARASATLHPRKERLLSGHRRGFRGALHRFGSLRRGERGTSNSTPSRKLAWFCSGPLAGFYFGVDTWPIEERLCRKRGLINGSFSLFA